MLVMIWMTYGWLPLLYRVSHPVCREVFSYFSTYDWHSVRKSTLKNLATEGMTSPVDTCCRMVEDPKFKSMQYIYKLMGQPAR